MDPTKEELIRETVCQALLADDFFKARPEIRIISRKSGDVSSLVEVALCDVGAGVVVRTPVPSAANVRFSPPVYSSYLVQILTLESPLLAEKQGIPSADRISTEVERILNGFEPESMQGASPRKWRFRLEPENPREDQSTDDSIVRLLSRFKFAQE